MFSPFYPRHTPSSAYYHQPSSYYSSPYSSGYSNPYADPYGQRQQQSPYARALAQQRARELAQQQEKERLARARYLPNRGGYDYDYRSDDEESYYGSNNGYYLDPRQRVLLEAKRRQQQEALAQQQLRQQEQQRRLAQLQEEAMRQATASPIQPQNSPLRRSPSPSPVPRSPSQPASTISASTAATSIPERVEPTPEQRESAALTLQSHFRAHRAHRAISALSSQFDALRAGFLPPAVIDYQTPAGVVSVPVPPSTTTPSADPENENGPPAKLAYTPTNVPLHTYAELLARLLVSLDAVESRGNTAVRERRRAVVRRVESEAARLECFWRGVWRKHLEDEEEAREKEEEEMREGEKDGEEGEEKEEQEVHAVIDADEPALPYADAAMSSEEEDTEERSLSSTRRLRRL
ncbi:hypothetical protein C8R45DRAFT_940389 [Mycena sanguinolenta]|nr:hypothetical protein C8R45DRAFT_940389 [Mycena sanguinolenta]